MSEPSKVNSDEILSTADFTPTRWEIRFENTTSQMNIPATETISILEIGDKELTFELPAKSCAASQNVLIAIRQAAPTVPRPVYFEFTGKVKQADKTDDGRLRVTIGLVQFDEENWRNFLDCFAANQDQITAFLKAAKGY